MTNPHPIVARHAAFAPGSPNTHAWGECYGTKTKIHESASEPGLFDRVVSAGPIERTAPAHDFHAAPSFATVRTEQIALSHANATLQITLDALRLSVDDTRIEITPAQVTVDRGITRIDLSDEEIRAAIGPYSTIVARPEQVIITGQSLVYAMLLPKAAEVVRPGRLVALTADGVLEAGPGSSNIIGACHVEIDTDQVAVALFANPVGVEAAVPVTRADTLDLDTVGRVVVALAGSTTLRALNSALIGERVEVIRV